MRRALLEFSGRASSSLRSVILSFGRTLSCIYTDLESRSFIACNTLELLLCLSAFRGVFLLNFEQVVVHKALAH